MTPARADGAAPLSPRPNRSSDSSCNYTRARAESLVATWSSPTQDRADAIKPSADVDEWLDLVFSHREALARGQQQRDCGRLPARTIHGGVTSTGRNLVMWALMASSAPSGTGTLRTFRPFGRPNICAWIRLWHEDELGAGSGALPFPRRAPRLRASPPPGTPDVAARGILCRWATTATATSAASIRQFSKPPPWPATRNAPPPCSQNTSDAPRECCCRRPQTRPTRLWGVDIHVARSVATHRGA